MSFRFCTRSALAGVLALALMPAPAAHADEPPSSVSSERPWGPSPGLLWMEGDVGWSAIDLNTLSIDVERLSVAIIPAHASGLGGGLGLGFRLAYFTLGARARFASFRDSEV